MSSNISKKALNTIYHYIMKSDKSPAKQYLQKTMTGWSNSIPEHIYRAQFDHLIMNNTDFRDFVIKSISEETIEVMEAVTITKKAFTVPKKQPKIIIAQTDVEKPNQNNTELKQEKTKTYEHGL